MKKLKKCLAVVLALVMCACCLPEMGSKVQAETTNATDVYHAYTDFSVTNGNPNGAWKYQMRKLVGGEYQYTDMTVNGNRWEVSGQATITTTTGGDGVYDAWNGNTFQNMSLTPHTESAQVVLAFTAPKSGVVVVDMGRGCVGAALTPSGSKAVHFSLEYNDAVLTSADVDNGTSTSYKVSPQRITVSKGDVIRFVVARNVGQNASTRINPTITYDKVYSFNAYNDYSMTKNPNGVWTYQTKNVSSGVYTNLTWNSSENWWGAYNTAFISTAASDQVTGEKALLVRPDTTGTDIVLTFTAPVSGKLKVSMTNGGVFAPYVSNGAGQLKFVFMHNNEVVDSIDKLDKSSNTARFFGDTKEITVEAGDVLRFEVHRNFVNNQEHSHTYFNPQIDYVEVEGQELGIYNAYNDYSEAQNPNGVWTYQTVSNGTYKNETAQDFYGSPAWGALTTGVIRSVTTDKVTGNPALYFRPEQTTRDVVLTFTAPTSGKVKVSMANGGVFAPASTSGNGEIKFTFKHNETVVKSIDALDASNNNSNRFFSDTVERTVTAGDTLRFVVHRNKAVNDPVTYFNPQIEYTSVDTGEKGITYYISSSTGNDSYSGISEAGAWKSLEMLSDVSLKENDRVLLKAGDTFTEQWVLNKVQGTKENPVYIGAYGDVAANGKPVINPGITDDTTTDIFEIAAPVIKLNDAEGLEIENLKITGSGVGVHLGYNNTLNHEYVRFANCDFVDLTGFDITDHRDGLTKEYHMATAITVSVDNYNIGVDDPALIGLYIDKCTTNKCGTLYAPASSLYATNEGGSDAVHGLYISGTTMTKNDYYGVYLAAVEGGYMTDCVIDGCGAAEYFTPGTAGILFGLDNYAVINTEIKNQQRGGVKYDGVAIDFEQLCDNVIVQNCWIHDNTGSGVLMYDSGSGSEHANTNCKIVNNVFENNASEAKDTTEGHDDPLADIRITSGTGYAAKDCIITGNQYFNNLVITVGTFSPKKLTYKFVNDKQVESTTNTIENNTELDARKNGYLEDKDAVLATYSQLFGNYNESEYKADVRTGASEAFATIVDAVDFAFADTFGDTASDNMKKMWVPSYYSAKEMVPMVWNSTSNYWNYANDVNAIIAKTWMHPAPTGQTVLQFVAPKTGRIKISINDTLSVNSVEGSYITILDENLQTIADPIRLTNAASQTFAPVYVTVHEGEHIYFCLSKGVNNQNDGTNIKPQISYVYNDVNGDAQSSLDVCDIVRMKKMVSGEQGADLNTADYNGDKAITDDDVAVIREYCVNWWDIYVVE